MLAAYAQQFPVAEVFTHNALAEYGHFDHILVRDVVKATFYYRASILVWSLPIPNPQWGTRARGVRFIDTSYDPFRAIKDVDVRHNVWTFGMAYLPPAHREYHPVCQGRPARTARDDQAHHPASQAGIGSAGWWWVSR